MISDVEIRRVQTRLRVDITKVVDFIGGANWKCVKQLDGWDLKPKKKKKSN